MHSIDQVNPGLSGGQVGQQARWTEQQAQHLQQFEHEQHAQDSSADITP